jgi:hypothetical protein
MLRTDLQEWIKILILRLGYEMMSNFVRVLSHRNLKQLIYIFVLVLSAPSRMNAQINVQIDSGLQWFYKNYPQEKVYVQTDKDNYISGQSLWFSIYAMSYGIPSEISKIVYIELVSPYGKVVAQAKLPMDKGKSEGDLFLPDSLKTGAYQLRCFTTWMLNFDEHFIFHKTIYIQNPIQQANSSDIKMVADISHYHIDFFPEGGELVDGNLCRVAFKAVNRNGLPVDVSGEITDEQNNHVAPLQTIHDGMGDFSFLAHALHTYHGNIHFPDGSTITVQMPEIKAFGVTLRVTEQNDEEINIAVFHHDEFANQFQDLTLAVYQNSGRTAVYPIQIEKGKNIFSIKKAKFSSGILRFTIFNANGIPLAERVTFLDKNDRLEIGLQKDSLSFKPGSKNELTIQVKNAGWEKDFANFSVAITDADLVPEDSVSDNMNSAFLLSSELKGYIHDPSYYFLNNDDKTKKALDLVMLTNGWRHFKWENILNERPPDIKYSVEKEQDLEGEILGYNKNMYNKESFKLKILIQNEDSSRFIGYAEPDSNGRFILSDYPVKGRSTIFFEGIGKGNRKGKDLRVQFSSSLLDSFRTAPYLTLPLDSLVSNANNADEISFMLRQKKGMLKPVTVRGQMPTTIERIISKYVSNEFQEGRASSIDFINNFYSNNNRIFDFLKGRFPGLVITGTEDLPDFEYEGMATLHNQPTDSNGILTAVPYFFVNEVLTSWEDVKTIPFSDIALIQFLPPPVAMAPFNGGFRGVITVYLKRGDDIILSTSVTEKYQHYSFNGFSITREFYSPDYTFRKPDRSVQDFRSTLYWNPRLIADPNGKLHFHFFNSDKAKRFLVVIEGMDSHGRIGSFMGIVDGN